MRATDLGPPSGRRALLPRSVLLLVALLIGGFLAPMPAAQASMLGSSSHVFQVFANASTTRGTAPLQVIFSASEHGASSKGARYSWNLGDGSHGNARVTVHTYADPGTFQVTLSGTDNGTGALSNASLTVVVSALATGTGGSTPQTTQPLSTGSSRFEMDALATAFVGAAVLLVARYSSRRRSAARSIPRRSRVHPSTRPGAPAAPAQLNGGEGHPSTASATGTTHVMRRTAAPMATLWLRGDEGRWAAYGTLPMTEATPEYLKAWGEAMGASGPEVVCALPLGAAPTPLAQK